MKQNIVKDLSNDEVRDRIVEERAAYAKLKMSHAVSPIENPLKIKSTRRLIARLETEYKKRLMASSSETKKKYHVRKISRRALRKEKTGIVTSNKMKESIVVSVERKVKHPI